MAFAIFAIHFAQLCYILVNRYETMVY